jgi:hypothetical protein
MMYGCEFEFEKGRNDISILLFTVQIKGESKKIRILDVQCVRFLKLFFYRSQDIEIRSIAAHSSL